MYYDGLTSVYIVLINSATMLDSPVLHFNGKKKKKKKSTIPLLPKSDIVWFKSSSEAEQHEF